MKLENQVCSLELAKRLKELGVPQESYFWWVPAMYNISDDWEVKPMHRDGYSGAVCAFTVAEFGAMLLDDLGYLIRRDKHGMWSFALKKNADEVVIYDAPTEADARAKMLIYLIENSLIDVKEL